MTFLEDCRKSTLLVALTLIVSCTSDPHPALSHGTVPSDRQLSHRRSADAQLTVHHNAAESRCPARLLIDDQPAADLRPGEVAHFGLTIGAHRLAAVSLPPCKSTAALAQKVLVKAGDALIFKLDGTRVLPDHLDTAS